MCFSIQERENRKAGDEPDHDERGALGVTAADPNATTALVPWDQVYGSHADTSSAASPAAIASRCGETPATASWLTTPTVWERTSIPKSFCSASAKPSISSAAPLRTTRETLPPPSWVR